MDRTPSNKDEECDDDDAKCDDTVLSNTVAVDGFGGANRFSDVDEKEQEGVGGDKMSKQEESALHGNS